MNENDVYIGLKADTIDGSEYWEEAFKKMEKLLL